MAERRSRMKFEASEEVLRATRMRAALEDKSPSEVVEAALAHYLAKEIAEAREHLKGRGSGVNADAPKQPRK